MRFVDSIIADFLETGAATEAEAEAAASLADEPERVMEAIEQLSPADRAILRQRVDETIAQAREAEQQRPGAFVEVRRPH